LGPELSRIVKGSTSLAIDARANLDAWTALIDNAQPVLDSQSETADSIANWAGHLASVTDQLRQEDPSVAGLIDGGASAFDEARQLVETVRPTLPILMANLVNINSVAIAYQPAIEQLLVLVPQGAATTQGGMVPGLNTKQDYVGPLLDFNLQPNNPPLCNTGFLPQQQQRSPALQDAPPRAPGDLYCRVPQDSIIGVRGARNYPCITRPGKRAPTAAMCESDEQYVPLNDGFNWKGDPNATLTGQGVPQLPPGTPSPEQPVEPQSPPPTAESPPSVAVAEYDPTTGTYLGPDGNVYTQSDLSSPVKERTWQNMLIPNQP
jgi:phospholipid/cholesterol/gamma-HCH transport system substrate-binding protein